MSRVNTRYGQPGIYNASPPTLNDGEGGALQLDQNGNLKIAASISIGDIEVGGIYNSTPPSLTNGQKSDLQLDSSGRLITNNAPLTGAADSIAINDGTNTANVLSASGTAVAQGANLVASTYLSVAYTTTSAQAVASTDAGNYNYVSVYVATQGGSSTVNFQVSEDNSNWLTLPMSAIDVTGGAPTQTSTGGTAHIWGAALPFRYFRLNVTGIVSGTTAGTVIFKTMAVPPNGVTPATATGAAIPAGAFPMGLSDGTNLQMLASNQDITVLTSAGRTSTQTQADQTNLNGRGIKVVLDMTVVGTGSVTLEIDGKDAVSGKYYAILTGAAVAGNSTNVYTIFPGATAVANVTVNDILPKTWRIKVTANNSNSATYSVGASVIW